MRVWLQTLGNKDTVKLVYRVLDIPFIAIIINFHPYFLALSASRFSWDLYYQIR